MIVTDLVHSLMLCLLAIDNEKWILDEMELTSSGSSGGGGSEIPLIPFPSDIIESLPYSAVWFMMDRTELCL
ncbi:hypothetical protein PIB30_110333, partial [Stylosanthes scabra]|nr:hypothetical protein [Stylosanthes scabra]